jgi:lipoprotein-anchoring transpeptidase ErfK/SrfK
MKIHDPCRIVAMALAVLTGAALAGAPTADAAPVRAFAAEPAAAVQLEVSLGDRTLQLRLGDEVVATYDVAVGKEGHRTPTGTFHIRRIIWNPSWTPPNASWARGRKPRGPGDPRNPMGRVKIFFAEPDYYIHGTDDESSIGTAASHGCIRMRNDDAIELARLLMEHAGETRPPAWYQRVLNRVTRTEEVRLTNPLPVRIRSASLADSGP